MGLFDFWKRKDRSERKGKPVDSTQPDLPIPFGMKVFWLAVREDDPEVVMEKLGCTDREVSNWQNAFYCMGKTDRVFVTPCFGGYVAVINLNSPLEEKEQLDRIAAKFEELQFFSTMRIVDLSCWARYFNGRLNRRYYYVGESGETYWDDGELTAEERELGLTKLPYSGMEQLEDYDDFTFPGEDDVDELAAKWGFDPFMSEYQEEKSTGFLCRLVL